MTPGDSFRVKTLAACRICGSDELLPYLDLGEQPPSNSFIRPEDIPNERSFPLTVALCGECGLSQLLHVVSAADIFDDYVYLSSTSKALCDHYQGLADDAVRRFQPDDGAVIVDIGCNDGIMLTRYPRKRFRLLGIEPSSAGEHARKAGFEVVPKFFARELGSSLARSHGRARLITATNVFAHVDDIRSFAEGIEALLTEDGVFIIEFPYLEEMLEHCYFDTVYHEHLSYLALTPLLRLFEDCGLRAFAVERVEIGASGPALRLFVSRRNARFPTDAGIPGMAVDERRRGITSVARYREFAGRVASVRDRVRAVIAGLQRDGHRIGAFAAPAKGNTLLNYLRMTPADIVAVSENNALKVGKVTPGSHIPIVAEDAFLRLGVSHALLLAWNYVDFFLKNSAFIQQGGRFLVPLPEPTLRP
ncbi:MAG: class I SAM-dependent methyltransferase [Rhodospirillales bacterium]|nr:class I SAM-dependent methyltransferase [Rhodospirillales bacterium]